MNCALLRYEHYDHEYDDNAMLTAMVMMMMRTFENLSVVVEEQV